MRVIFMGTPQFAVPTLERLLERGHDVVAVLTQPDRPAGRGRKLVRSPVKLVAEREGIPVLQPTTLRDEALLAGLRAMEPDVVVVVAYGHLLPPEVLGMPRCGCVNVHASLLPEYRGAAPINWAVIRGEKKTGVTTFRMDETMDTGGILLQREVPIADEDDAGTLYATLSEVGAEALVETLEGLEEGTLAPLRQDVSRATRAPKLKKADGEIDWAQPAEHIWCLVRGTVPWPVAYTHHRGKVLKVWKVTWRSDEPGGEAGEVLAVSPGGVEVRAGTGVVVLLEVQPENGRRMGAAEFARGHGLAPGDRFS
jgi:methionyl-tRNA formyltransferase